MLRQLHNCHWTRHTCCPFLIGSQPSRNKNGPNPQRVHVANNLVLGIWVIVIIVQVLGKYMIIRYLTLRDHELLGYPTFLEAAYARLYVRYPHPFCSLGPPTISSTGSSNQFRVEVPNRKGQ